jgi:DNA-binding beta-propeller fold protein YncE
MMRKPVLTLVLALSISTAYAQSNSYRFRRIATIPIVQNTCLNKTGQDLTACTAKGTSAEIAAASEDGNTLIYTDALTGNIGFIDISNPASPKPAGVLAVSGDPTSVAVAGNFALIALSTGSDSANPAGNLAVVNLAVRSVVRTIPLPGQPDSVAVSPNRAYAAVVIENQRDEAFCVGFPALGNSRDCRAAGGSWGTPPQTPAGLLVRVVLTDLGNPNTWTTNSIPLTRISHEYLFMTRRDGRPSESGRFVAVKQAFGSFGW